MAVWPAQLHRSAWLESIRQSYLSVTLDISPVGLLSREKSPAVPVILLRILSPRFSCVPMQPHAARNNLANRYSQMRYAGSYRSVLPAQNRENWDS